MRNLIVILFVSVVAACGSDEENIVSGDAGLDVSEGVTEADGSGVGAPDAIGTTDADTIDSDTIEDDASMVDADADGSGDAPDTSVDAIQLDVVSDAEDAGAVNCTTDDDCDEDEYCNIIAAGEDGGFESPGNPGVCEPLPPMPDPQPEPDAEDEN